MGKPLARRRGRGSKKLIERLEWEIKYGEIFLSGQLEKPAFAKRYQGVALEPPDIAPGLDEIYETYQRLSRRRLSGFNGPEYIREVDIQAMLDMQGVPIEDHPEWFFFIDKLDSAYLNDKRSKE